MIAPLVRVGRSGQVAMETISTVITRDLEITYPLRLGIRKLWSLSSSLGYSVVLVGVASFYRIMIVQRRASQLHKRSAHL